MTLYCNNSGTMANSKEFRIHKRSKYIEGRYHLIREIVARENVEVKQIFTHDNITDSFTKTLSIRVFEKHLKGLSIKDCISLLQSKWEIVGNIS